MQLNGRISASFTRDTPTELGVITSVEKIGLERSVEKLELYSSTQVVCINH
jgi:hypothetical protein